MAVKLIRFMIASDPCFCYLWSVKLIFSFMMTLCPKCGGQGFEIVFFKTIDNNTKVYLVTCCHCYSVIGSFASK